jgi:hypothetical protein
MLLLILFLLRCSACCVVAAAAIVVFTKFFVFPTKISGRQKMNGDDKGSLCVCIRVLFPWRRDDVVCRLAERSRSETQRQAFHLLELDRNTLRDTDLDPYLRSQQLGSNVHDLFDLDLDYAKSDVIVCAALTNSQDANTLFFLMTRQGLPSLGDCTADVDCVTSTNTTTGYVIFPNRCTQKSNAVFYVCAVTSGVSGQPVQVCGDGVVIDDDPPSPGTVAIDNAVNEVTRWSRGVDFLT